MGMKKGAGCMDGVSHPLGLVSCESKSGVFYSEVFMEAK